MGAVIGVAVAVACCSVFYALLIYRHFPPTGTLWFLDKRVRAKYLNKNYVRLQRASAGIKPSTACAVEANFFLHLSPWLLRYIINVRKSQT